MGLTIGSALIPFLVGVALGDLLHGLPINSQHQFTGSFLQLLTPFGLWSGLTFLVLSLLMGATFLTLKTTGELHERARRAAAAIGGVAVVVTFGFMTWIHVGLSTGFVPKPIEALALFAVIAAAWAARRRRRAGPSLAAAVGMGGTVATLFIELYPRVMISSTNTAYNLTIAQHGQPALPAQGHDGRRRHLLPAGAVYQAWSYQVFRKRLSMPKVGNDGVEAPAAGPRQDVGHQSPGLLCMMPPSAKIVVAVR